MKKSDKIPNTASKAILPKKKSTPPKKKVVCKKTNKSTKEDEWEIVHDWGEDLFTLYRRGDEYDCWPNLGMQKLIIRLGLGIEGRDSDATQRIWWAITLLGNRAKSAPQGYDKDHDELILQELTSTIGVMINDLKTEKSEGACKNKASRIGALVNRAVERMISAKYQSPQKHTGANDSKEMIAIATALSLCQLRQCLPSKSEIIGRMTASGHGYVNDRGRAASRWNDLFKRCGLEVLKF